MRAGIAAGTAPSDPFAALVAGPAAQLGRGAGDQATSFGAALERAGRMLDVPPGSQAQASPTTPVAVDLADGSSVAPNIGEGETDAMTEPASGAAVVGAGITDAVVAVSVEPAQTPVPTAASADGSAAASAGAGDEPVAVTVSAAAAASASRPGPMSDAGAAAVLVASPSSATAASDVASRLGHDRAATTRASADAAGLVSATVTSSDAASMESDAPPAIAPSGLVAVPVSARAQASALPLSTPAIAPATAAVPSPVAGSASSTVGDRSDQPAGATAAAPSVPVVAPAASTPVTGIAEAQVEVPASARSVATQVSPVVVSIAQRPAGTHHLTMTVSPDTLGPVTVRAHIGQNGDVRIELVGATDAGREALRAIVSDLRRDLSAVMPHANLSLASASASSADAGGTERFAQPGPDQGAGEQGDRGRATGGAPAVAVRVDAAEHPSLPTPALAVTGASLDTFA